MAVLSPCTNVCTLDPATGLCLGCGRTMDEIVNWPGYNDAERRAIVAALPERLAAAGHRSTKRKPR